MSLGHRGGASRLLSAERRPLRSIEEAASVLNVSESWLRKRVAARDVPFTKIGRQVRFTDVHIDEIIAAGEHAVQRSAPRGGRGSARTRL